MGGSFKGQRAISRNSDLIIVYITVQIFVRVCIEIYGM